MKHCFKFGGIIQFWHCLLVLTLQIYVLTRSVRKYISLRNQIFDARYGLNWDTIPLHFYINCIVFAASLTLLMAFLLCANSNYLTIGSVYLNSPVLFSNSIILDDQSNRTNSLSPVRKKRSFNAQKTQSTNFPIAYLCHVLAAYFLLLPMSWVLGEQAKNEAVDPSKLIMRLTIDSHPFLSLFKRMLYICFSNGKIYLTYFYHLPGSFLKLLFGNYLHKLLQVGLLIFF